MSDESYTVDFEDEAELMTGLENAAVRPQQSFPKPGILSSLSVLTRLGTEVPPFHPDFRKTIAQFTEGLEEIGGMSHRPSEVHIIRQNAGASSRYVLIGPSPSPSPILHGFSEGASNADIETLMEFLRDHDIAMLTFQTSGNTRTVSRFIQLALSLSGGEKGQLRAKMQFQELHGVFVLHTSDVAQITDTAAPWMNRVAAARVRSLLIRLPNPQHLEAWLHNGEGKDLIKKALRSIGAQTSITATLLALVEMPSPGDYQNLLELALQTLDNAELKKIAQDLAKDAERIEGIGKVGFTLGLHLHKIGEPEAASLLERLYNKGNLKFEQLPEDVRRSIRVSNWSEAFESSPFTYLQKLDEIDDASKMEKELNALGHVYRELVQEGRFANAELLVRYVQRIGNSPKSAPLLEVIRQFFGKLQTVPVNGAIDAFLDAKDSSFKGEVLTFLTTSEARGLPILLTLLGECEAAEDRRLVCNAIIKMGRAAHPILLSQLGEASTVWYVRRNILFILGRMGIPGGADALLACIEDGDTRVQKEAITSYLRTSDSSVHAEILAVGRRWPRLSFHCAHELVTHGFNGDALFEMIWSGIRSSAGQHGVSDTAKHWVGLLLRLRESYGPLLEQSKVVQTEIHRIQSNVPRTPTRDALVRTLGGLIK